MFTKVIVITLKLMFLLVVIICLWLTMETLRYDREKNISYERGGDLTYIGQLKSLFEIAIEGRAKVTIRDPHNKIIRSYGAKPISIEVEANERIVRFDSFVLLKSDAGSIDIQAQKVKLGGYMGYYVSDTEFTVYQNGGIHCTLCNQ